MMQEMMTIGVIFASKWLPEVATENPPAMTAEERGLFVYWIPLRVKCLCLGRDNVASIQPARAHPYVCRWVGLYGGTTTRIFPRGHVGRCKKRLEYIV